MGGLKQGTSHKMLIPGLTVRSGGHTLNLKHYNFIAP